MVASLCYLGNDRELACSVRHTFLHQWLVKTADVEALDGEGQLHFSVVTAPKQTSCPRVSKSVHWAKHLWTVLH